jgi:hypothetical protein
VRGKLTDKIFFHVAWPRYQTMRRDTLPSGQTEAQTDREERAQKGQKRRRKRVAKGKPSTTRKDGKSHFPFLPSRALQRRNLSEKNVVFFERFLSLSELSFFSFERFVCVGFFLCARAATVARANLIVMLRRRRDTSASAATLQTVLR